MITQLTLVHIQYYTALVYCWTCFTDGGPAKEIENTACVKKDIAMLATINP